MRDEAAKHPDRRGGGTLKWLLLGSLGGIGVLLALRHRDKLRPFALAVLKDVQAFRSWLSTGGEKLWEEAEDLAAEARHANQDDIARQLAALEKEKQLLERLSDLMKQREGGVHG